MNANQISKLINVWFRAIIFMLTVIKSARWFFISVYAIGPEVFMLCASYHILGRKNTTCNRASVVTWEVRLAVVRVGVP